MNIQTQRIAILIRSVAANSDHSFSRATDVDNHISTIRLPYEAAFDSCSMAQLSGLVEQLDGDFRAIARLPLQRHFQSFLR